jgi:hypothetical protein
MKKVLFILTLSMGVMLSVNAQISAVSLQDVAKKASTAASSAGIDVNSLSSSILSKLTSSLALTNVQKPQVSNLITTFLTQKSKILSLSTTDKVKYAAQLAGLSSTLQTKLSTVLTSTQFAKFLNLKPATNTPTNVLSQLFY